MRLLETDGQKFCQHKNASAGESQRVGEALGLTSVTSVKSQVGSQCICWDQTPCPLGSDTLSSGIRNSVLWDQTHCPLGSETVSSGIRNSVLWDQKQCPLGSDTLSYGIRKPVLWDQTLCPLGHLNKFNSKGFRKVMDIFYIHMFIYTEFEIINMLLKERHSKYKQVYTFS